MSDLSEICSFCHEMAGNEEANLYYDLELVEVGDISYILDSSKHFSVIPCVGALADDYVLVVSKRHVLSVGWMDNDERTDLRNILTQWSERLAGPGKTVVIFEHGSYDFRDKGGACYDHAHVHVLAVDRDPSVFVEQVQREAELRPVEDWTTAAVNEITSGNRSYLAMQYSGRHLLGNLRGVRSQFFRRHLVEWLGGDPGGWDWLVFPERERVFSMIRRFHVLQN